MLIENAHISDILGDRLDVQFRIGIDKILNSIKNVHCLPLGEIAHFSSDSWDQKSLFKNVFPYIEISSIDTKTGSINGINMVPINEAPSRAKKIVKKDDILISMTRPNRGAICLYNNDYISIASTGFSVIRDINDIVLRDYLFLVLRLPISLEQMMIRSSGGNYPAIIESELKKIQIPIPSIDIQKKVINTYEKIQIERINKIQEAQSLLYGIDDYLIDVLQVDSNSEGMYDRKSSFFKKISSMIGSRFDVSFYKDRYEMISSKYPNVKLSFLVEIDPTISVNRFDNDMSMSFVPMECIDEQYGEISEYQETTIVKTKGYTKFEENDLLWAKITPCMQNGKSAIARNLINGIGCGSTEFFVMRPKTEKVLIDYIYLILRHREILKAAQNSFGGSAGQQRVSVQYLKSIMIPLPDISMQQEIIITISSMKSRAKQLQAEGNTLMEEAKQRIEKLILA